MNIDRRNFVKRVSMGVFTVYLGSAAMPKKGEAVPLESDIQKAKDIEKPAAGIESAHTPKLSVPMVAEDGKVVPIEMTLDHPMEKDHYIERVDFYVLKDPIMGKGSFLFSPMNGKPDLKFQARMDAGLSTIYAVVHCNKHGRWVGQASMRVVGGGC